MKGKNKSNLIVFNIYDQLIKNNNAKMKCSLVLNVFNSIYSVFYLEKDILLLIIIYRFLSKIINYLILIYFKLGKQKFHFNLYSFNEIIW